MSRRAIALLILAALVVAPTTSVGGTPEAVPSFVPAVLDGYAIAPLAPLAAVTAAVFGPEDDLFVTTAQGTVLRLDLEWTDAGPAPLGVSTYASGFSLPLGLEFDDAGNLYVADSTGGTESGRVDGRITRVDPDGEKSVIVSGLPNGRHNTNNLRWGPDGRLYIANGNPNDSGDASGDADVFPYSGAILSIDVAQVSASPAVLRWRDAADDRIAAGDIASHPLNADFADKVHVLGFGFRNVYDVAFSPAGDAYTATNGADVPSSQDLLYKITPGADHGFPFCYNVGAPGGTGDAVSVAPNPLNTSYDCSDVPRATALLGWHVCATGLDFPNAPGWGNAVYVAECGPFYPDDLLAQTIAQPEGAPHNVGHKVVRVALDGDGEATRVQDFVTGLALPTDVVFGPDGAMYIADVEMVYRVIALPLAGTTAAPAEADAVIVTGPQATTLGYAPPVIVVQVGGSLTYTNLDLPRHDVVALDSGPDDQPWCHDAVGPLDGGHCPLFRTPLIGFGESAQVQGLENLEPLTVYPFHCTIHSGMRGTLVALPAGV